MFVVSVKSDKAIKIAISKKRYLHKRRKQHKKKPLLVACDVYRPAAIDQLKDIGKQLNIEVYDEGKNDPVVIAEHAIDYAKKNGWEFHILTEKDLENRK